MSFSECRAVKQLFNIDISSVQAIPYRHMCKKCIYMCINVEINDNIWSDNVGKTNVFLVTSAGT